MEMDSSTWPRPSTTSGYAPDRGHGWNRPGCAIDLDRFSFAGENGSAPNCSPAPGHPHPADPVAERYATPPTPDPSRGSERVWEVQRPRTVLKPPSTGST